VEQGGEATEYITIDNAEDNPGLAPVVSFYIQSAPISEIGVNGVQALDMLKYTKNLFASLNEAFPCEENILTMQSIDEAIMWQNKRTADREKRGVEGKNEE
jgi:hypothetical protein